MEGEERRGSRELVRHWRRRRAPQMSRRESGSHTDAGGLKRCGYTWVVLAAEYRCILPNAHPGNHSLSLGPRENIAPPA
jgi:hypothetical protein